jgi:NTE family protein
MARLRLGIALGGGAARGWAHIGVLRGLAARGLRPDCIAGASIGSLVGAAAAANQLEKLEDWVRALTRTDVLKLLDARFRGGVLQGNRVMSAIETLLSDCSIEDLGVAFGAVATDMHTGREIWLRTGSMLAAVRASCAMPGLFPPIHYEDRWLIDGGVVNPVPVSLCYAMGADIVIAVNLNTPHLRRLAKRESRIKAEQTAEERSYLLKFKSLFGEWLRAANEPTMIEVLTAAIGIMQERIARSRLAGEPPHLEICPIVDLELMDFHRAGDAIAAGEQAVSAVAAALDGLQAAFADVHPLPGASQPT